jgi:chloramphenicol 3-O-phosphotransferase
MKKRLVLILNGKGGVGKSFFAVSFIQYLKDRPFPHVAFWSFQFGAVFRCRVLQSFTFCVSLPKTIILATADTIRPSRFGGISGNLIRLSENR